jgi:hypothetical protein
MFADIDCKCIRKGLFALKLLEKVISKPIGKDGIEQITDLLLAIIGRIIEKEKNKKMKDSKNEKCKNSNERNLRNS